MDDPRASLRRIALALANTLVSGRGVILTGSAARSQLMAEFLVEAGAWIENLDLPITTTDTRERFHAAEALLAEPTDELRRQLDRKDPEGQALVYAGSFSAVRTVCGRRVIGARSSDHLHAERKDRQRDFLTLVGDVIRLEDILRIEPPAVLQGIPSTGIAMAASHTFLLPRSADDHALLALTTSLRRDCSGAVATRFTPGVPCTFYGFITAIETINLGPVEALVFWDPHTWRIQAPGILRPVLAEDNVLAQARLEVQRVAERVHRQLAYVGAFGTDGVLTEDGYVIHEINTRVCAGFGLLNEVVPDCAPLAAVDLLLREMPNASSVLSQPLRKLETDLWRLATPAYRLWDEPARTPAGLPEPFAQEVWAHDVRTAAARGRIPLREMKEVG